MKLKYKSRREKLSLGTGIGISVGISIITGLILSSLLAVFILNERIDENAIKYVTPLIALIASVFGCVIAGKLIGEKLAVIIGATAVLYLVVCIAAGILLFDGGFHNLWINLLGTAISWVVSCAICIRGQGSSGKRKRAYS